MSETDNSYMFVDEEALDIASSQGTKNKKSKGKYVDETITGSIEEESTISLLADEDIAPKLYFVDNSDDSVGNDTVRSGESAYSGKGFGIASLFFGVISITFFLSVINFFTSVIGIICGLVQIRKNAGRGLAITGIICSILSIIMLVVCMKLMTGNEAFVNMITQYILVY